MITHTYIIYIYLFRCIFIVLYNLFCSGCLHARRTPLHNSMRQFWASVCVCVHQIIGSGDGGGMMSCDTMILCSTRQMIWPTRIEKNKWNIISKDVQTCSWDVWHVSIWGPSFGDKQLGCSTFRVCRKFVEQLTVRCFIPGQSMRTTSLTRSTTRTCDLGPVIFV